MTYLPATTLAADVVEFPGVTAGDEQELSVQVLNGNDEGVENIPIEWEVRSGEGTLTASSTDSDRDGEATVTLETPTAIGTTIIVARNVAGAPLNGSPMLFNVTTVPGEPVMLVFDQDLAEMNITADEGPQDVRELRVLLQDSFGNSVTDHEGFPVELNSTSDRARLWHNFTEEADPDPETGNWTLNIAQDEDGVTFYYTDRHAGSHTLTTNTTQDTPDFGNATLAVNVSPGKPAMLAFTDGPAVLPADQDVAKATNFTLELQDRFGNNVTVTQSLLIDLNTTSPGGEFWQNQTGDLEPVFDEETGNWTIAIDDGASNVTFLYNDTQAGVHTIAANLSAADSFPEGFVGNGTFENTTRVVRVTPLAPSQLGLIGAPDATVANESVEFRVELQDHLGNNVTAMQGLDLELNTTSPDGRFWADDAELQRAGENWTITLEEGSSNVTFRYNDTLAGQHQINVTVPADSFPTWLPQGFTNVTHNLSVTTGTPFRLALLEPPQGFTAGQDAEEIGNFTLELQDRFGNNVTVTQALSIDLNTTSPGGKFWQNLTGEPESADFDPGSGNWTITIDNGASNVTFLYNDTLAGEHQINVSVPDPGTLGWVPFQNVTHNVTVIPDEPSRLTFTTAPETMGANESVEFVVALQDHLGNKVTVADPMGLTLELNTTSIQGGFWVNEAELPQSGNNWTITLEEGASNVTVRYNDTLAGEHQINVTVPADSFPAWLPEGLANATHNVTVNPGTPVRLTALEAPDAFTAGEVADEIGNFTLELQDEFGNSVPVAGPLALHLNTTSPRGVFWENLTGEPESADFDPSSGNWTITIDDGASNVTFLYNDTLAGEHQINVTVPDPGTHGWVPFENLTHDVTVAPAEPTQLNFTRAPQELHAGESEPVSLALQDRFGNDVTLPQDLELEMNTTSEHGSFWVADSELPRSTNNVNHWNITLDGGTSSVTFRYNDTGSGGVILSANVTDEAFPDVLSTGFINATHELQVEGSRPAQLVFVEAPGSMAAGEESKNFTVVIQDFDGNNIPVAQDLRIMLNSSSDQGTFWEGGSGSDKILNRTVVIEKGTSASTFRYNTTKAGEVEVLAGVSDEEFQIYPGGLSREFTNASHAFDVTPLEAVKLNLTEAPVHLSAGEFRRFTVQREDQWNNPAFDDSPVTLNLTKFSETGKFERVLDEEISQVTIPANDASVSFWYRETIAGEHDIVVGENPDNLGRVNHTVTIHPNVAVNLLLLGAVTFESQMSDDMEPDFDTGGLSAGDPPNKDSDHFFVAREDAFGNFVTNGPDLDVALDTDSPAGRFWIFDESNSSIHLDQGQIVIPLGSAGAEFWYNDTIAGKPELSVSADGYSGSSLPIDVGPADMVGIGFLEPASTMTAGEAVEIELAPVDRFENIADLPSGNDTLPVELNTTSETGTFQVLDDEGNLEEVAQVNLTGDSPLVLVYNDTTVGEYTLNATHHLEGLFNASHTFTVDFADLTFSAVGSTALDADAGTNATLKVRLADKHDNVLEDVDVTWDLLDGPGSLEKESSETNDEGVSEVEFETTSTIGAVSNVTATVLDENGNEVFDPVKFTITTQPPMVGGADVGASSLLTEDTGVTYTFSFTTSYDWPADGTFVVTFPSGYGVTSPSATMDGCDGNVTTSLTDRTVTITRDGEGSECSKGTAVEIQIAGVVNREASGFSGSFQGLLHDGDDNPVMRAIFPSVRLVAPDDEDEDEEEDEEEPLRPARVTSLQAVSAQTTEDTVVLRWTAPEAHGEPLTDYRIGASKSTITSANFGQAVTTQVELDPDTLAAAGDTQHAVVSGLDADTVYYFAVQAEDADGNRSQMSNVVNERTESAFDPVAANKALQTSVSVRPVDDGMEVTWDPETVPGTAAGIIVWRINSPATFAGVIQTDDPAYEEATFVDADGKSDSGYILTLFYGLGPEQGYNTESLAEIASLFETTEEDMVAQWGVARAQTTEESSGLPWWALGLIVLVVLALIAVVLFYYLRMRKDLEAGVEPSSDAAHPPLAENEMAWAARPLAHGDETSHEGEGWAPDEDASPAPPATPSMQADDWLPEEETAAPEDRGSEPLEGEGWPEEPQDEDAGWDDAEWPDEEPETGTTGDGSQEEEGWSP